MKFYVFTFSHEGSAVALRLQEEGEDVTLAVIEDEEMTLTSHEEGKTLEEGLEKKRRLEAFEGLVDKKVSADAAIEELLKIPERARGDVFVFFDFNCCFQYAAQLAGKGFLGNFPTEEDRLFEVDREKAQEFVRDHYPEIRPAYHKEFKSVDDAVAFIEDRAGRWVVKADSDKFSTFVPESTWDEDQALEQTKAVLSDNKAELERGGFILTTYIEDPVEVTPQVVFWNGKPVYATLDLELKKFGAGDIGQMTGCSADLVLPIPMESSLIKMAFPPAIMKMAAKREGMFVWDASILFDRKDGTAYMGEFCPNRCGYNAFYSELELCGGPADYFSTLAAGGNPAKYGAMAAASVRMFQFKGIEHPEMTLSDDLVVTYSDDAKEGLWPMSMKKDGERVLTAGYSWNLAVMTGGGSDPGAAFREAFKRLAGFACKDTVYRPMQDLLSISYPTSILSRLKWVAEQGLVDG